MITIIIKSEIRELIRKLKGNKLDTTLDIYIDAPEELDMFRNVKRKIKKIKRKAKEIKDFIKHFTIISA